MEALVQARGVKKANQGKSRSDHIRYRAHATLPAGSAKGWTKSDNGRDVMVRVPWLCLGLYRRSERESSSGSICFIQRVA